VLPEYAATAGKARDYLRTQSGKQPGNPQKAVEALIAVVDSPEPPLRLLLDKSALTRLRDKLSLWQKEVADWESVTTNVDYPEA